MNAPIGGEMHRAAIIWLGHLGWVQVSLAGKPSGDYRERTQRKS